MSGFSFIMEVSIGGFFKKKGKNMYKIKDEIIKEVCEKLEVISRLSLEAAQLLKSAEQSDARTSVDYDPDEYIFQHLRTKINLNGGGQNE